jgi:hypothetical protein
MRIVFTIKIAPVIGEADVSHNGLFIGLWTEAEVALGFIVACALCLPKLVQVKGKRVRSALSYASSPWSALTSRSRKSASFNSSGRHIQHDSRGSKQMQEVNVDERPMFYEDRVEQRRQTLQPNKQQRHDVYAIPSTAGNSEHTPSRRGSESQYSEDIGSPSTMHTEATEEDVQTATVARPSLPRNISISTREVPVRLDVADVSKAPPERESRLGVLERFEFDYLTALIDREPRRSIIRS